jgi:hypothetical protein
MNPLLIQIVLHYYSQHYDFGEGDFSAPAVRHAIDWLRDDAKLIEANDGRPRATAYKLTARGKAYACALKALPLPVQIWVQPGPELPVKDGVTS